MSKSQRKSPQKQSQQQNQNQQIPPALKVFSKTRDIDNPYHLDGDMEMYSQQKVKMRQQLSADPDIRKQIQQIVKMYEAQNGIIQEKEYKRMQKKMAVALRPDIEEEELQFVIDEDWKLDSKNGSITVEEITQKIFELVDVWTIGVDKMEYVSFIKLLSKKIGKNK